MTISSYYLGCPIWSFRGWTGNLFSAEAKPADYLRQYAAVFNTVEGNTTFYAVPDAKTVERWRLDAPAGFHFCFKLPRTVTHDKRLRQAGAEIEAFFTRMAPLGSRLGPFLIQLPPSFGPVDLPALEAVFSALPATYQYVVEVRHRAFFGGGREEQALNDLLAGLGADRAIFDTRALRTADPRDPVVAGAQQRKPDLPVHPVATGRHPLYRFVAHPDVAANLPWLEDLADLVAEWIAGGRTPYVYMHSPYDVCAPQLGREFHRLLAGRAPVGEMPVWPGEVPPPDPEVGGQLALF